MSSNEANSRERKMSGGGVDGKVGVGTEKNDDDNDNPDLLDSIRSFRGFVVDEVLSVNDLTKAVAVLGR